MKLNSKSSGMASMSITQPSAKFSKTNAHTRVEQSAAQNAVRWVGIGSGSPDLSTNRQHMKGFGLR